MTALGTGHNLEFNRSTFIGNPPSHIRTSLSCCFAQQDIDLQFKTLALAAIGWTLLNYPCSFDRPYGHVTRCRNRCCMHSSLPYQKAAQEGLERQSATFRRQGQHVHARLSGGKGDQAIPSVEIHAVPCEANKSSDFDYLWLKPKMPKPIWNKKRAMNSKAPRKQTQYMEISTYDDKNP